MPNPFTQDDQDAEDYLFTGKQNQIPSAPPMPVMPSQPPPPTFNPQIGLPPTSSPLPPPPAAMPPVAPPPDPLSGYLAQQKDQLNKYGPDQQMAVEQDILKRRHGFGQIAGNAMTGLADSIMQGVARAGPGQFQQNLQNRNDKTEEGMRSAVEKAGTGNIAKMKQEMELAQMDPTSPISKLAQRSATPTLAGMGLTPDEIAQMPASLISTATTQRLSLEEIRAKAEEAKALHELTAGVQGRSLAQIREHQAAEEKAARDKIAVDKKNAATKTQQDAGKTLAGMDTFMGGVKKATAGIPLVGDPALQLLKKQAATDPNSTDFQTEADAEAAGLPPGTVVTIGGRKARVN